MMIPSNPPIRQGDRACSTFVIHVAVQNNPGKHGHGRAMPKPIQRGRHELGNHDILGGAIQTLQERGIDQVEEIQQPDPHDPSQEMDPTKDQGDPLGFTRANAS